MSNLTAMGIVALSFVWPCVIPLGMPRGWTWIGHFCPMAGDDEDGVYYNDKAIEKWCSLLEKQIHG